MTAPTPSFRRGVLSPIDALAAGWRLVRDRYWLFLGISAAGVLIGSYGPFGILLGPMMCGIYACYGRQARGRPVRFEMVFDGFETRVFVQSLLATLGLLAATMAVFMPIACAGGGAAAVIAGSAPDHTSNVLFAVLFSAFFALWIALSVVLGTVFLFTYPLIADRKLDALEALSLSARAVRGNLGGALGLVLLTFAMGLGGVCCCYVGAFFVMPITFGAQMAAYETVFGLLPSEEAQLPGVSHDLGEVQP